MNAFFWIFPLLLLLIAPTVEAAPTRADFAYGLPLEISGDQAFYELELPQAVYRDCRRADLGDLRVFNAAGQVVPHLLRAPENRVLQKDVVASSLPFFPLPPAGAQEGEDLSIHVERAGDGTIIDIRNRGPKAAGGVAPASAYLLDAGGLKDSIEILELQWPDASPDFLASLLVETSSDLRQWRRLTSAAVARLAHQGLALDRNRIELPPNNSRYLRLSWGSGQPQAVLSGVRVLTRAQQLIEKPQSRSLTLTTLKAGDGEFRAELAAGLPISGLRILPQDRNSLAGVRLYAADSLQGPWQERWHGLVYNLASNGTSLEIPAIELAPRRQRFWKLVVDAGEATLAHPPQLFFNWQPERLVFLAQGEGPYTLAYGSGRTKPADFPVDGLLARARTTGELPQALTGEPYALGGPEVLKPGLEFSWRKLSLWGVLFLGVLLIGGMSFSLYRKLRDS